MRRDDLHFSNPTRGKQTVISSVFFHIMQFREEGMMTRRCLQTNGNLIRIFSYYAVPRRGDDDAKVFAVYGNDTFEFLRIIRTYIVHFWKSEATNSIKSCRCWQLLCSDYKSITIQWPYRLIKANAFWIWFSLLRARTKTALNQIYCSKLSVNHCPLSPINGSNLILIKCKLTTVVPSLCLFAIQRWSQMAEHNSWLSL